MPQKQKQLIVRNSSIELLRIIATTMIIFHHFAVHGGFEWGTSPLSIPRLWYNFIIMGGKIGVNVFVMISGYHLITNDGSLFNLSRIIKYIAQVSFYSVVIFIIFMLTGTRDVGIKTLAKVFFPLTFSEWWFASAYFVLFLLHPFINKLLHSIDRSTYQKLIVLLVVCWSAIPTFTSSSFQGNPLLWFVTLYTISGYIRLYGLNKKFTAKHYSVFLFVFSLLTYASSVIFALLGTKWGVFASHVTYFFEQDKLTTLLVSLCLFMVFATLKMNYHKWINMIASTTFGVYLIHDSTFIRPFLWTELFQNAQYQESLLLIPYSIVVVIIVFAVCSFVDLLRQRIIEKPLMMMAKRCSEPVTPFESFFMFMKDFVFGK